MPFLLCVFFFDCLHYGAPIKHWLGASIADLDAPRRFTLSACPNARLGSKVHVDTRPTGRMIIDSTTSRPFPVILCAGFFFFRRRVVLKRRRGARGYARTT
ncbi:hypothetical protein pclt_cds_863 [Pandoravirus celtis]|uniref:Uncharacterized protein n=1 Tax=Pandoravirus celtis TaxID=2568002 RepID=A0A4D6EI15_9VIRU|nr:hypothetical protein pclt_cds_863 [Pandoravirus celtis]